MVQKLEYLRESPSQTAGPYVHIGCTPNFTGIEIYGNDLGVSMKTGTVKGQEITIRGIVFDGTGTPLRDAMIEIWQADAAGLFASQNETRGTSDPNFTGWGRSPGDMNTGEFCFETVKPGAVPFVDGRMQAPHITMWIVARGLNMGLHTRIYFEDEADANSADPILSRIEHQNRISTLLAKKQSDGTYRFDVHLQGPHETIFFDI
ncbi:protocatechuate 3,4-dioxygenase subunit alpha [Sulfitobacter sp. M57]|uniref:protocatechuate 3,4-dioxygenase subunit alpha n=1 Tax=unclassified Sulfitobacter TaxID=196795 RepID=UPI0023E0E33B|nr:MULTISPECIES: protocatechuate 3,4-dioxygenase subunit alpha [unclassified Sulfitobacter]MDF3416115.1 protocatechuate 3,4-dioxygenase subunit alpha [Sulfitobacter sp. KE5]MDF3423594.1 protocatechuate 3,4-dioxygenase subunit alpha [Sulfitobacter sp. KE43]MDF3434604.1 protocatechuate 3,4-dioxygenase subunit alpha [Sulfitobacter sp. KE42]MDF3460300.1 protocatechuate 3,4-dioxygenase subunit alpha [Sulfitobacter sp. S74]MDF3464142.1 protocatechuate 3,4-dioxygenase subunit alpha [Sulfitobacter sp.